MESNHIISIVTPTFNQGDYIEQTIDSVLSQDYPHTEYIIVDGGSTDKTLEIIKKYEKHLKYWVSEPDSGQANAINKGLRHCKGEVFNWLNSDDYLEPGALKAIAKGFSEGVDVVAGEVRIFSGSETIEHVHHADLSARGLLLWEPGVQFVQPGVWLKRELIDKSGGIDEVFHYAFDWDLYIRYLSRFSRVKALDNLLVHFRYHDNSKTVSMQHKFKMEENAIIEKLTSLNNFPDLRRIADFKSELNKWMPFYKDIVNDNSKSNFYKAKAILNSINANNIILWRVAAGALRMIYQNKKYSDE